MNDFVILIRTRIKTDGSDIINAVKYPWNSDQTSAEYKAVTKQYFNLQNTDADDSTLVYHSVFILDKNGIAVRGEAFDYRVEPEPEPEAE
jgi:hypothetical protein